MASRPTLYARHTASLCAQTDLDFEHVVIVDEVGRGVEWANKALAAHADGISGDYVLILDDDDVLLRRDAVAMLKRTVREHDQPHIVIYRGDHGELGILPHTASWGEAPVRCKIGSFDFITRADWYKRDIAHFGQPTVGDFAFLDAMWQRDPRVVWLDEILVAVQRISRGAPDDI
jgi:glycosyltransferase involved in cell wall biosynthesis